MDLEPSQYQIKIGSEMTIFLEKILAIPEDNVQVELHGLKVTDPAFGEAFWIDPVERRSV